VARELPREKKQALKPMLADFEQLDCATIDATDNAHCQARAGRLAGLGRLSGVLSPLEAGVPESAPLASTLNQAGPLTLLKVNVSLRLWTNVMLAPSA
jgi:hypothetical protein